MNSLFVEKQFAVPIAQGIRRKALELRHERASGRAGRAENLQIPCYFRCYQGMGAERRSMVTRDKVSDNGSAVMPTTRTCATVCSLANDRRSRPP
jgi:hypothetical protein